MQPTLKRLSSVTVVLLFSVVSVLAVGLAPIYVQIGRSHTEIGHTVSTATVASPNGSLILRQGIEIRVAAGAQPEIGAVLARQLADQLRQRLPLNQVSFGEGDGKGDGKGDGEGKAQSPVLLVEITESHVQWTPVWSGSEITVEAIYASDGDLSWRHAASMIMNQDEPTVHTRGTIHLTDRSPGLFSRFGYRRHLGQALGSEVFKMLESPLFNPPGS